jgi:hypothetical protein
MAEYVNVDDSIIGRRVLYNDSECGIVVSKVSEGNARIGSEYSVLLDSGMQVYITDRSLWKFKILK